MGKKVINNYEHIKYEYLVVNKSKVKSESMSIDELNKLGNDGWILSFMSTTNQNTQFVFYREKL